MIFLRVSFEYLQITYFMLAIRKRHLKFASFSTWLTPTSALARTGGGIRLSAKSRKRRALTKSQGLFYVLLNFCKGF